MGASRRGGTNKVDYKDTSDLYEGGRATMGMGYQVCYITTTIRYYTALYVPIRYTTYIPNRIFKHFVLVDCHDGYVKKYNIL